MFKIDSYNGAQIIGANFFNQNYKSLEHIRSEFEKFGFEVLGDWEDNTHNKKLFWISVAKDERREVVYAYDLPNDYDEKVEF